MRILVTGSRTWTDERRIADALAQQYHCHEHPDCGIPYRVVSGHCPDGADAICELWASRMGWDVEPHPANWVTYGRAAGPIRNAEMVLLGADICLAFIKNGSRGASDCANKAEKAGIPTIRYTEDSP
jgi:YspA, cpYpsA-related SLOG family